MLVESSPRAKIWVITIAIVVVVALLAVAYFLQRAQTAADEGSQQISQATTAPVVSASPASQSVAELKSNIAATDVADVKTTLKGLKSSLSMFNR